MTIYWILIPFLILLSALFSASETAYNLSNINITDQLAAVTDADHPTGLHVSEELNCWHRMVYAYVRMKNAQPTENGPGALKVPDLTGLSVMEAGRIAASCGLCMTGVASLSASWPHAATAS